MTQLPAKQDEERFGFASRRVGELYIFEIEFSDHWRLVGVVRRFVEEYYGQLFQDEETLSRLALATHEMMENAIKYSVGKMARLTVEYSPSTHTVLVRSSNPATSENVETVGRLIDALAVSPDPMGIYLGLMRHAANSKGSGLGLARICVEAQMKLEHSYQSGCLQITATSKMGELQ